MTKLKVLVQMFVFNFYNNNQNLITKSFSFDNRWKFLCLPKNHADEVLLQLKKTHKLVERTKPEPEETSDFLSSTAKK